MNKRQKKLLLRITVSAALLLMLHFLPVKGILRFILYLAPYLIAGYDILFRAFKGVINRQVFDENFLMAIATVGAMAIGAAESGDYTEAAAVMILYQTGQLFESYAVGKSRRNISRLMDVRPDYANIEKNGKLERLDPDKVEVNSVITVLPGEKVPIDGIIEQGCSSLNTAALTGEGMPRDVCEGDEVISGCVNMTGVLKIRTTKPFGESTVSKILDLVENAGSRKSKSENFISKFARIYTPAVCLSALAVAVLPPLVRLLFLKLSAEWLRWLYRALSFLVASCPCALVLSIPLTFFAGIGAAGRRGILIKGSNYLEALSKTDTVVFDKTGTLTKGVFEVKEIKGIGVTDETLIEYAALAESASPHPISKGLKLAYGKQIDMNRVKNIRELSGKGVIADVDGKTVAVGNAILMQEQGTELTPIRAAGTVVYVSIDRHYAGYIVISDALKPESKAAIDALKHRGVKRIIMMTGDNQFAAEQTAETLGVSEYHYGLMPNGKANELEKLLASHSPKTTLAFVGDGINDAPVLARADIGVAMGAMGSDAAIEAADAVIMDDDPRKLVTAINIANGCMRIVRQNVIFTLLVKAAALVCVALGIANMWIAVFADVGVMALAVLNSIRALLVKDALPNR